MAVTKIQIVFLITKNIEIILFKINGMTGGYSMVVIGYLCYINTFEVAFVDNNMIFFVLIALSIFNIFNFRVTAKCFSGDVGSISIAFVIVFLLGLLFLVWFMFCL